MAKGINNSIKKVGCFKVPLGSLRLKPSLAYQSCASGASLVLPRRMEKFVCSRGGHKEGVDARGDSVSRSTCSSTASRQSEGPTANSSEDPRDYRDREDSWKDLPPVRGDRTSMVSNTDHVTPGTTPSHKPRYLTLRNETPSLSARPPTSSIDGSVQSCQTKSPISHCHKRQGLRKNNAILWT